MLSTVKLGDGQSLSAGQRAPDAIITESCLKITPLDNVVRILKYPFQRFTFGFRPLRSLNVLCDPFSEITP